MPWIIYVVMVLMFTPLVGIMWLLFLDALGVRPFRFRGRR